MKIYVYVLLSNWKELEIKGKSDLVHNPFSEYQELPVDPNSSYEWLQARDIFEQMGNGRTLLILGEPGAGKTIALLKLAKRFIEKTQMKNEIKKENELRNEDEYKHI